MKIELTETEIIHIMDSLRERINDLRGEAGRCGFEESADLADELEELEHDLFEASARKDDGWNDRNNDAIPDAAKHDTDLFSIVICDAEINAETQMFNAGAEAREKVKARARARGFDDSDVRTGSLAAQRRQEAIRNEACAARMMAGTATPFIDED